MFEYQMLPADGLVSVEELNKLGRERWELISVIQDSESSLLYFFKRSIHNTGTSTIVRFSPPTHDEIIRDLQNGNTI